MGGKLLKVKGRPLTLGFYTLIVRLFAVYFRIMTNMIVASLTADKAMKSTVYNHGQSFLCKQIACKTLRCLMSYSLPKTTPH